MLTKNLKFDNDVLDILRSMDWQDGGTLGIITGGQLERKLYERVNKALEAMGGKWNRSKRGHVFQFDPRPSVDGLLENGSLTVERDGFFETPRAVVERMLELVPMSGPFTRMLEPSAGMGAILKVLQGQPGFFEVLCDVVEKNTERYKYLWNTYQDSKVYCADFLAFFPDHHYDRIYMNPPFEELQDVDHVQHAYRLLADYGKMVSVMAESAFFRNDKKSMAFRDWLDEVGGYSEPLPDGAFKESGTGVKARLVVIERE